MKRISDEPAFVVHHYDWSESSLIVDVFTRHHGRVALVAKGAKRPSSGFRAVLLPLQPLQISYGGDAEIRTLKVAEWAGHHVMPSGDALLSGYYVNELLMRLLARDDPHPVLFDVYAAVVRLLAAGQADIVEPALRAFELLLLREVGLLPALDAQTLTLQPLQSGETYCLQPQAGLRAASDADRHALSGAQWLSLQVAMDSTEPFRQTLLACGELLASLKPLLRALLHYHCDVGSFRTRQLMMDVQSL